MKSIRNIKHILLLPVVMVALSGCVIAIGTDDHDEEDWEDRQARNEQFVRDLKLGADITAIETRLGNADFVEAFQRNGETYTVLYYRTQRNKGDGRTSKDETTPLVFVDGGLVGWGESAIEYATAR